MTADATHPEARADRGNTTPSTGERTLLIGTRGSNLATTQSTHVLDGVVAGGHAAELHIVHTPGDASQAAGTPVRQIGVGVFTETLRSALAAGECDIAVHSFKDLPTAPDPRFKTVVPQRVNPREVLVSRNNLTLMDLPKGAKVGTGAPRRVSQIRAARPDLQLLPLRGNIDTRMRRTEEDLDAVVLARAGLERVGLLDRAAESIDPTVVMPAPAQGALSVEVRADDEQAWNAVKGLDHLPSHAAAVAERAMLSTLEAGCTAPVAAHTTWSEDGRTLSFTGGVFGIDGQESLVKEDTWRLDDDEWRAMTATQPSDTSDADQRDIVLNGAKRIGRAVGLALLDAGAAQLVADAL
ncbi:hydroxymethylbilane synthase [Corynebacterium falsenii]|uniref:hydroxymethylbilane synthase n=1 Tax=Corynebacterium falsenii TaxID=108486 RepID=UPI001CCE6BBB|nr:hydroxymethylbilane synthase [Corynebacterium falsenii]UBI07279.1 hydroxymethylbilane synthase [Corynebacterium falsenii]